MPLFVRLEQAFRRFLQQQGGVKPYLDRFYVVWVETGAHIYIGLKKKEMSGGPARDSLSGLMIHPPLPNLQQVARGKTMTATTTRYEEAGSATRISMRPTNEGRLQQCCA